MTTPARRATGGPTEVQLTTPGEVDIYVARLLGLPGVGIGSTEAVYADTSATPNLRTVAEQAHIEELFTDPLTQITYDQGFVLLARCNRRPS